MRLLSWLPHINNMEIESPINYIKCEYCQVFLPSNLFYRKKDKTLDHICKSCRTAGKNIDNPEDFFDLMEYYDIPYIPEIWKCCKGEIAKILFGKYLNRMKLPALKQFGWEDSEKET